MRQNVVRNRRFGVQNGSERRLRRGRSRPRGLVVTAREGAVFSMSAVNAVPFSEHDPPCVYSICMANIEPHM